MENAHGVGAAESSVCKGDRTRAAIVDAAVCMASRVGLNGLSIGKLATKLDISKSGLFAHFRSKENLQTEVLVAAADRFIDGVVHPALVEPPGEARLRRVIEGWLAWVDTACSGGCLFVQAAVELDDRPGPLRDTLVQLQSRWMGTLARMVQPAIDMGLFRQDLDPEQFAFELQGLMLGYHHASRLLRDPRAQIRTLEAVDRLFDDARAAHIVGVRAVG